jgi:thioredoxin-related protein
MNQKSLFTLIALLVFMLSTALSQENLQTQVKINWLSFEEAVKKQQEQARPIFIDMYTDWCGWCKKLDSETFSDPGIAYYINNSFYPVKFDAETKDTIHYKGKQYVNTGTGKRSTHELAMELLENRPSYPSMVYINAQGKSFRTAGYMDAKKLEPVLIYFAEQIYNTAAFDDFNKGFETLYRGVDSLELDVSGQINWFSLEEAVMQQAAKPKKLMIYFYSENYQRVASELMSEISLKNPHIAEYINTAFYPVKIEASTKDTIRIFNQTYINEQKLPAYPHQFVIALLQNRIYFPSIVFFNESNEMIPAFQGYFSPKILEPYFHFVAEDAFANSDWASFYKSFKGKVKTE